MKHQKYHSIKNSPFFRLKSIDKLAEYLNTKSKRLIYLENMPLTERYRCFPQGTRDIQQPIGFNRFIHNRLHTLLSRILSPDFVFSGKKGFSHVDNALAHLNSKYAALMDIEGFYRNSKREYVFRFFLKKLEMASDIANILTNIVCFNDFIPTGSPLSQLIAYWAYSDMFEEIETVASSNNFIFSLFVDDLTFSSQDRIRHDFHLEINAILKSYRLNIKRKKLQYRSKNQTKIITGCAITPDNKIKVRNKHRVKYINNLQLLLGSHQNRKDEKLIDSALGLISSLQAIEPQIFMESKRILKQKISFS
ncbi:reverse transcriptase family protein [Leptospira kmetyi]|uniref:reverse transcriptase family protein n=1 Tax=Leptospira kmetyi TaxID=408139 RepID=UPI0002898C00|nr:reverse transcriptase family protein [Leptospira kmetyi]EQA55552.1 RNA-directed DNA polymerase [Leptospira kmetyi serovar Malaysia str. Bejo-Iso9]